MKPNKTTTFSIENTNDRVSEVVNYILDKIRSGEWRAGQRIPTETEFSKLTGVSRTSVREALKRLEAMTIVHIRRGDGTYISEPEDISFSAPLMFKLLLSNITWNEVSRFREILEFSVMRSAIENATEADIAQLMRSNENLIKIYNERPTDFEALYLEDMNFHLTLSKISKNKILSNIYNFSLELFGPLILGNYKTGQGIKPTYESHNTVVSSLQKRDVFLASYAAHQSVDFWYEWIKRQDNPTIYFSSLI